MPQSQQKRALRLRQLEELQNVTGVLLSNNWNRLYCELCGLWCNGVHQLRLHQSGRKHRSRVLLDNAQSNKGNVIVNPPAFPVPSLSGLPGQPIEVAITIEVLETATEDVHLLSCRLLENLPDVILNDMHHIGSGGAPAGILLSPGCNYTISLKAAQAYVGVVMPVIVLKFKGFQILRQVKLQFDTPSAVDIGPTAPYERPQIKRPPPIWEIVPGEPPTGSSAKLENGPGQHLIPNHMRADMASATRPVISAILKEPLKLSMYQLKMSTLLFVEELQLEVNIRQFDMKGVIMDQAPQPSKLLLQVPGLAENRPSVLKGDALYVTAHDAGTKAKEYQGFVHLVCMEEVVLQFHKSFHAGFVNGMKWDVRFGLNRGPLNFLHRALKLVADAKVPPGLLFPSPVTAQAALPTLTWVDRDLNPEQRTAVQMVVWGSYAPAPYVIFGPPGTGKTKTVVEAMLQALRCDASARVVAVAPSNTAADLLALRLLRNGLPPSQLLRVNSYSRPKDDTVPPDVLKVSCWDDVGGHFYIPHKERLMDSRLRVVAVTCIMAAKLYASGVPPGHFSHIFMDEAGHAEEPEALAALAGLVDPRGSTRVVLAGDPRQLGPIVHSSMAKQAGLATSLLERLEGRAPHRKDPGTGLYDARCITKLVRNYRSHPSILALPSQLFYDNELQTCGDPMITQSLLGWEELPNPKFPFIFHGVKGQDEQEGNSPSWFNVMEVKLVVEYVKKVLAYRRLRLPADEIGVIAPYRKQVQKLQKLMGASGLSSVRVGSTEEYQGQERRVIIISTVRSNPDQLDFDRHHHLGFVANPKRFNVAITRAKALVIVVGNPELLAGDPNWRALLRYCVENGAYKGCPPPPNLQGAAPGAAEEGDPADRLARMLAGLALDDQDAEVLAAEGPEWRRSE